MSKLTKLVNNPSLFFKDMALKRLDLEPSLYRNSNAIEILDGIIKKNGKHTSLRKSKKNKSSNITVPNWYNNNIDFNPSNYSKDIYLYLPWIREHGDALVQKINKSDKYEILPFELVNNYTDNNIRKTALRYARENPDIYRKLVTRSLALYKNHVKGFILTLDWTPVMRIIVEVCRDLDIPTILIPHESVFADSNTYYMDIVGGASVPKTDLILSWGDLQTQIFTERGYPLERIQKVGAPKFDVYSNYQPTFNREQFCTLFNLDLDKEIILFASQPLDSQFDTSLARSAQNEAVSDLIDLCIKHNLQLIVRTPPSKDSILDNVVLDKIQQNDCVVIDDANFYLVTPTEAIYHSAYVSSVNSTMLFEAILMGRKAFSTKYIEFEQIWAKAGIPAVKNSIELEQLFYSMQNKEWAISKEGYDWAANQFGIGKFDGQASNRIIQILENLQDNFSFYPKAKDRIFSNQEIDLMCICSSSDILETTQRYLKQLVGAQNIITSYDPESADFFQKKLRLIGSADAFFQWGSRKGELEKQQLNTAKNLNKPFIFIEEGFIRSIELSLSGAPTLSVILDDKTAYYDATRASRLETLLDSNIELEEVQLARARSAIDKIVNNRVSKYNHVISSPVNIKARSKKTILIVDQRFDSASVCNGFANQHTFKLMLNDAIKKNPDANILIKYHPESIIGVEKGYYSLEEIQKLLDLNPNIQLINFDVNPYTLLDVVDEVYVVTSDMGFEALMAGKTVHCYGIPFYAGWGITQDQQKLDNRRLKRRTLEELFYFTYIELSRYFDPNKNQRVQVEEIVDYIIENR